MTKKKRKGRVFRRLINWFRRRDIIHDDVNTNVQSSPAINDQRNINIDENRQRTLPEIPNHDQNNINVVIVVADTHTEARREQVSNQSTYSEVNDYDYVQDECNIARVRTSLNSDIQLTATEQQPTNLHNDQPTATEQQPTNLHNDQRTTGTARIRGNSLHNQGHTLYDTPRQYPRDDPIPRKPPATNYPADRDDGPTEGKRGNKHATFDEAPNDSRRNSWAPINITNMLGNMVLHSNINNMYADTNEHRRQGTPMSRSKSMPNVFETSNQNIPRDNPQYFANNSQGYNQEQDYNRHRYKGSSPHEGGRSDEVRFKSNHEHVLNQSSVGERSAGTGSVSQSSFSLHGPQNGTNHSASAAQSSSEYYNITSNHSIRNSTNNTQQDMFPANAQSNGNSEVYNFVSDRLSGPVAYIRQPSSDHISVEEERGPSNYFRPDPIGCSREDDLHNPDGTSSQLERCALQPTEQIPTVGGQHAIPNGSGSHIADRRNMDPPYPPAPNRVRQLAPSHIIHPNSTPRSERIQQASAVLSNDARGSDMEGREHQSAREVTRHRDNRTEPMEHPSISGTTQTNVRYTSIVPYQDRDVWSSRRSENYTTKDIHVIGKF